MSAPDGLDRRLTAWLGDDAPAGEPEGLLDAVTRELARSDRTPGWAISERWLPMQTRARLGALPRAAIMLATIGLLAALLTSLVLGSGSSPSLDPVLPPPWGPAANGLIAYDAGADIWVMGPDGSDPKQLTSAPTMDFEPSWSPDGQLLAYWEADVPGGSTSAGGSAVNGVPSLVIIDAQGNQHGRLAIPGSLTYEYTTPPSWSPDSQRLVIGYQDGATKAQTLAIVDVDAMTSTVLVPGTSPTWSPQGTWIAYRRLYAPTVDSPVGVGLVHPDGSSDHQLTKVTGSDYAFAFPQWSEDEQYVTFYAGYGGTPGHDVWVARADGTKEWAIGNEPREEYWPSFSPDGSRVAFQRDLPGENLAFNYVVTDPDGSNPVDIASPLLAPALPGVWAPDGTRILGIRPTDAKTIELYQVDPAGVAEPVVIPLDTDWVNVSWQRVAPPPTTDREPAPIARNGLIAFASSAGVETLDPDTGERQVVIPGEDLCCPVWAPNGSRFAYIDMTMCCKAAGTIEGTVHVANADGSGDVDVTLGRPIATSYLSGGTYWSTDSRRLAYGAPDGDDVVDVIEFGDDGGFTRSEVGGFDVVGIDLDARRTSPDGLQSVDVCCPSENTPGHLIRVDAEGAEFRLTDGPLDDESPVWSPDGTQIAFTRIDQDTSGTKIMVIGADGSDLTTVLALPVIDEAPGWPASLEWSPDGTMLVVVPYRHYGLFVVRADGSGDPLTQEMAIGLASWQRLAPAP